jgi:hypothetical protein
MTLVKTYKFSELKGNPFETFTCIWYDLGFNDLVLELMFWAQISYMYLKPFYG